MLGTCAVLAGASVAEICELRSRPSRHDFLVQYNSRDPVWVRLLQLIDDSFWHRVAGRTNGRTNFVDI